MADYGGKNGCRLPDEAKIKMPGNGYNDRALKQKKLQEKNKGRR